MVLMLHEDDLSILTYSTLICKLSDTVNAMVFVKSLFRPLEYFWHLHSIIIL